MQPWLLVLITGASAIILGAIIGIIVGKHKLKVAQGRVRRLLSTKERLLYSLCVVLGVVCLLFGVFFTFPTGEAYPDGEISVQEGGSGGWSGGGVVVGGPGAGAGGIVVRPRRG